MEPLQMANMTIREYDLGIGFVEVELRATAPRKGARKHSDEAYLDESQVTKLRDWCERWLAQRA
jgi:hypothetical protein